MTWDVRPFSRRERLERELRDIDASRQAQLAAKKAARSADREEDRAFASQWTVRLEQLKQEEEREAFERFLRNKSHQDFLRRQMEIKQRRKGKAAEDLAEEEILRKLALEQDEQMFEEYAAACMAEYDRKGRSTKFFTKGMKTTTLGR